MKNISAVDAAKMMRHELAEKFSGARFSVRTQDRGSIYVSWTDGPTQEEVERIADKYAGKGFDGSIDMTYHYKHFLKDGRIYYAGTTGTAGSMGQVAADRVAIPAGAEEVNLYTGYIQCSRHLSPVAMQKVIDAMATYLEAGDVEIKRQVWKGQESFYVDFHATAGTRARGFDSMQLGNVFHQHERRMAF